MEAKIDDFVDAVVQQVDPSYPTPIVDRCGALKKKCVTTSPPVLLSCRGKAEAKNIPVDSLCIQKYTDRFDGGFDPSAGCFEKAEAKATCQTVDDTALVGGMVNDFVQDVMCDLDPYRPNVLVSGARTRARCSAGRARRPSDERARGCPVASMTDIQRSPLTSTRFRLRVASAIGTWTKRPCQRPIKSSVLRRPSRRARRSAPCSSSKTLVGRRRGHTPDRVARVEVLECHLPARCAGSARRSVRGGTDRRPRALRCRCLSVPLVVVPMQGLRRCPRRRR